MVNTKTEFKCETHCIHSFPYSCISFCLLYNESYLLLLPTHDPLWSLPSILLLFLLTSLSLSPLRHTQTLICRWPRLNPFQPLVHIRERCNINTGPGVRSDPRENIDVGHREFTADEVSLTFGFGELTFEDRVETSSFILVAFDTVWDLFGGVSAMKGADINRCIPGRGTRETYKKWLAWPCIGPTPTHIHQYHPHFQDIENLPPWAKKIQLNAWLLSSGSLNQNL